MRPGVQHRCAAAPAVSSHVAAGVAGDSAQQGRDQLGPLELLVGELERQGGAVGCSALGKAQPFVQSGVPFRRPARARRAQPRRRSRARAVRPTVRRGGRWAGSCEAAGRVVGAGRRAVVEAVELMLGRDLGLAVRSTRTPTLSPTTWGSGAIRVRGGCARRSTEPFVEARGACVEGPRGGSRAAGSTAGSYAWARARRRRLRRGRSCGRRRPSRSGRAACGSSRSAICLGFVPNTFSATSLAVTPSNT